MDAIEKRKVKSDNILPYFGRIIRKSNKIFEEAPGLIELG